MHAETLNDAPVFFNEGVERKLNISRAGVATGTLGMALFVFALNYVTPAIWITVLFTIAGFSCLLWNYLRLFSLAGFALGVSNAMLLAIFHAYITTESWSIHLALFALQGSFWFIPLVVFHPKEKTKITISIACSIAIVFSIPFLKKIIPIESVLTLSTGVNLIFSLLSGIFLFSVVYWLIAVNKKTYAKEESLRKLTLRLQQDLDASEKKLSDYVTDAEKTQEEERKRRWISEGIASIGEILRSDEGDRTYDKLVSYIVKHLNANQAALFLTEEQNGDAIMKLRACYAYDRKKFIEKTIAPGEGLAGQCYLEKESIYITQVCEDFVNITSGLGSGRPRALLITPLKVNDTVEGVIEMASFTTFEKHQIQFVEQAASVIGSAVGNSRINTHTKELLKQAQMQAEQIRSQEEEMRQNLEELTATQEEMRRKEVHLLAQSELMELIIDNIPFPVFIKDEKGCYLLVNKAEAEIFNRPKSDIIGFDDNKFVLKKEEMDRIRASDRKIVEENEAVHFPEQTLTLKNGVEKVFKTSKIPFYNKTTRKTNILGVSVDLSDVKNVERTLTEEIEQLKMKLRLTELNRRVVHDQSVL